MKDQHDKSTGDMLEKRDRRKVWTAKQREAGRKQIGIWVTEAEREAINRLLADMRGGADDEQA